MKENLHALVEEVKRQQVDFDIAGQRTSGKGKEYFKKKGGGTSVNNKKRRIPAKKRRDINKNYHYGCETYDGETLLIDEMELEGNLTLWILKLTQKKLRLRVLKESRTRKPHLMN